MAEPKQRSLEGRSEDSPAVQRLLSDWGAKVRETAAYRRRPVRLDLRSLYRREVRAYRIWAYLFRGMVVTAGVMFVLLVWRGPELSSSRRGNPAVSPTATMPVVSPLPGGLMLAFNHAGAPPVTPEELRRVHALLGALQEEHPTCPASERLDYRQETLTVRRLLRSWRLLSPGGGARVLRVLQRLNAVLEPCMSPATAQELRGWAERMQRFLYLTDAPGKLPPNPFPPAR